ncbi:MAG: transketolase C-terminal domain-containing protein [Candidatus Thalassarchaeaceae archaeon]|nr:transketolase C-terminal domain-containing protein [Candidatus Thalassarchaeaceae archaeon]
MSAPSSGGASRDGYGAALLEMLEDDKVVVIEADLGKSTKSCLFRSQKPSHTVSLGIAEQNMMLVSAGLASSGYIPFASTFAIFTERGFEQVRNGIARPNLAVHLCGSHGGIHTGTDGSSAQSIEDLGIYRTLPNMAVLHPCDDVSTKALTLALKDHDSPSYTRTVRNKTSRIYTEEEASNLRIGQFSYLKEGNHVAILACGVMVQEALSAHSILEEMGIKSTIIDVHTIKPLDVSSLYDIACMTCAIVTAEDHNVIGGLGSAVAEALVGLDFSRRIPVEMVGVQDKFGQSGQPSELMSHYNLTKEDIIEAVQRVLKRK